MQKFGKVIEIFFFPENHWSKIVHIYMKAFWHSADLSLYKLWSPSVKVGDSRGETILTFVYWKESFKMKHLANFNQTLIQTYIAWWEFKFIQMKVQVLFKGGIIRKVQNRVGSSKYFLLMNHSSIKTQIYRSASWYSAESILFNSWSPGVMRGHNIGKHFYIGFNGENLWKSLQETTEPPPPQKFKFTCKVILRQ
jgi:hypothetical protein